MRKQYQFRPSPNGYFAWDVISLISKAKDLPIQQIDPTQIEELNESYWFEADNAHPTCIDVINHIKLIDAADFAYPIILCAEGRIMDGMHRVVKAVIEGRKRISAVRFTQTPAPDYIDIKAHELPYDD